MIQCCSLHGVVLLLSEIYSEFHEESECCVFWSDFQMWSELIHHKGIHQDVYNYAKTFKYHHASLKPLDLPSVVFSGLLAWFSSAAELGPMLFGFPIRMTLTARPSQLLERVHTSPDKKNDSHD
jgi:hypothetical protein